MSAKKSLLTGPPYCHTLSVLSGELMSLADGCVGCVFQIRLRHPAAELDVLSGAARPPRRLVPLPGGAAGRLCTRPAGQRLAVSRCTGELGLTAAGQRLAVSRCTGERADRCWPTAGGDSCLGLPV